LTTIQDSATIHKVVDSSKGEEMVKEYDPEIFEGDNNYLPSYEGDDKNGGCESISPEDEYGVWACTRIRNHEGLHAAHGNSDQMYATWD
jgi:hypothetical protein